VDAFIASLPYGVVVALFALVCGVLWKFRRLPESVSEPLGVFRGRLGRELWRRRPVLRAVPQPLDPERPEDMPAAQSNLTTDPANPGGENGGMG
jgi:hypothetical protein